MLPSILFPWKSPRVCASLTCLGRWFRVQHRFSGPAAVDLLERVTPASLRSLPTLHSTLACLLLPDSGGIVDDTVIVALGSDEFYAVTNAACRDKDIAYLSQQIEGLGCAPGALEWKTLDGQGLLALQGPLSAEILQGVLAEPDRVDLKRMYFGQSREVSLKLPSNSVSPSLLVSRGGYTGEDGFEISVPADATVDVAQALLRSAGPEKLRLAGLGARDSLRLEAGMCLYGHDLDEETTPVEAGLSWIVAKDRRATGGFHGSDVILQQLKPAKERGGVSKRRVGMIVEGAPAREGAEILAPQGEVIGKVTSGSPSPTLGKNIAMGYVRTGFHKSGTGLGIRVRGKTRKGEVVKMPFVPSRYWKQAAGTTPS